MAVDKRVLYIEDEKFFADTIEKQLVGAGYSVMLANEGEKGIAVAKDWKPDLILLDLLLPKFDGFEVLRALKDDLGTKHIPVIVLSNLNSEGDVRKAKELGAKDFFVKALTMPTTVLAKTKEAIGEPPHAATEAEKK